MNSSLPTAYVDARGRMTGKQSIPGMRLSCYEVDLRVLAVRGRCLPPCLWYVRTYLGRPHWNPPPSSWTCQCDWSCSYSLPESHLIAPLLVNSPHGSSMRRGMYRGGMLVAVPEDMSGAQDLGLAASPKRNMFGRYLLADILAVNRKDHHYESQNEFATTIL